jgi:hypothetical protein
MCISGCGGGSSGGPTPAELVISISFGGTAVPRAVAAQIGTNSWKTAALQGGTLGLTLPSGTTNYGIAYVCGTEAYNFEYVIYATVQDGSPLQLNCSTVPTSTGVATGMVNASNIPGTAKVEIIGLLGSTGISVPGASGSFSADMATGSQDIAFAALDSRNYMLAVHIVRSQTVPGIINSGNPITFLASDALGLQPYSVVNLPAGFPPLPAFAAGYMTANGTFISLLSSTTAHYPTISSAESQPGDYYAFAANDVNQAITQSIGTSLTTSTAGAIDLSLSEPLAYSAPTPAAFPSFNLTYAGFANDIAVSYWAEILWAVPSISQYTITVTATAAYQNSSTMLAVPDLSGLGGFLPSPNSGTMIGWRAGVYGGTYQWYAPTPANGSLSFVSIGNSFVVP